MSSIFPTLLSNRIYEVAMSRLPTVAEHFHRGIMAGVWHEREIPAMPFIKPDWACEETTHLLETVLHALFTLSDEEKKEFCDILMKGIP